MAFLPSNRRRRNVPSNLFDDFYNNMLDNFFGNSLVSPLNLKGQDFRVNIQEKDDEYIVEAELPGVTKEQVDLELNEGRLTISVKREESINEEGKNYIHRESYYSSMSRSLYLSDAREEGTRARLENGVLTIIVPREENRRANKISIE